MSANLAQSNPPTGATEHSLAPSAGSASVIYIYGCDCDGFRRGNGISFDSQDAYELGWTKCPCCKKPFAVAPTPGSALGKDK